MYARLPTEEELAGSGFCPEDYELEAVEVWQEHGPAISLFSSISTQWRVGMSGACGLDYNVLFASMDRMKLTDAQHDQLFEDVRVIESEALTIMSKKE